jgi:hypothetical protein
MQHQIRAHLHERCKGQVRKRSNCIGFGHWEQGKEPWKGMSEGGLIREKDIEFT